MLSRDGAVVAVPDAGVEDPGVAVEDPDAVTEEPDVAVAEPEGFEEVKNPKPLFGLVRKLVRNQNP